ncbi:adenylylsulfatase HINT3 [Rhodamnia argentea]|uniref:Adenylylsulfatase HINT3 n=1 Tax=Rhodamnia argentea TaxID=178133 RepID=A0A8B8QMV8_9MYRT|nr:adenylylsulfatase HINT3 [Rhodamnia argentea]XP_030547815.1 adenylylsulfatase HINT3 [Rhodamnia argentea]
MENRRLAVLCSHLRPVGSGSASSRLSTSGSSFGSSDDGRGKKQTSRDPGDRSSTKDCVFCCIIRGESPAFKLYEDEKCLCILDSNPLSHGHSLIIPKSHYSSLEATPPNVVAAMCSKVPFIGSAIMRAAGCDSFNLLVNNGAAAGQVIFHTHIHIIPRKASDCLWTSESLRRRPLTFNQNASQLVNRVREELSISNVSEESKGQESTLS